MIWVPHVVLRLKSFYTTIYVRLGSFCDRPISLPFFGVSAQQHRKIFQGAKGGCMGDGSEYYLI